MHVSEMHVSAVPHKDVDADRCGLTAAAQGNHDPPPLISSLSHVMRVLEG